MKRLRQLRERLGASVSPSPQVAKLTRAEIRDRLATAAHVLRGRGVIWRVVFMEDVVLPVNQPLGPVRVDRVHAWGGRIVPVDPGRPVPEIALRADEYAGRFAPRVRSAVERFTEKMSGPESMS